MTEDTRSGGTPAAAPALEAFKRALDTALFAHGDWVKYRHEGEARAEDLATAAYAAENAVVALYAGALSGVAPEPSLADRIAALTPKECEDLIWAGIAHHDDYGIDLDVAAFRDELRARLLGTEGTHSRRSRMPTAKRMTASRGRGSRSSPPETGHFGTRCSRSPHQKGNRRLHHRATTAYGWRLSDCRS